MRAMIRLTTLLAIATMISGCIGPVVKPPLTDRFDGIIDASELAQGNKEITATKGKTLAVIFTKNTYQTLKFNAELLKRFQSAGGSLTLNYKAAQDDAGIVLSEEQLMGALMLPLRSAFKATSIAPDIPSAFEGGADLVALVDLDLNYVGTDSRYAPSPIIHITHTANSSVIFIDKELSAGPDVKVAVEHKQATAAKGPDGNNRDFLYAVKQARSKMVAEWQQNLSAVLR